MLMTACRRDLLRRWRFFAIAGLFLSLSACSLSPRAQQERLARLQQNLAAGEAAWQVRDYLSARDAYVAASLLSPDDISLVLRLGMIHEHLGRYAEAGEIYRTALKHKNSAVEARHEITFRLALLDAFRLDRGGELTAHLSTLPADSPYAADLRAVQFLLDGDGRKALMELNQARTLPVSEELSAIILYHASRAYNLAGDGDRSLQSLYEAINHAGHSPLSRDIGEYREFLLKQARR